MLFRYIFIALFLLIICQVNANPRDLNQVFGKVYNVDLEKKQFEILTPTAYDPKTNEGKSRYLVYWNENTQFKKVIAHSDFKHVSDRMVGDFHYLDATNLKALKSGEAFKIRNVNIYPKSNQVSGLRKDGKRLVAWFKTNPKDKKHRSAFVEYEGKNIKVSLDSKKSKVNTITQHDQTIFNEGFYSARVYGSYRENKFILSQVLLYPLLDPRTIDDPSLPRVLVIGDSISMNYHEAAKSALKGKANYYRVEGNAGPSDRGVSNLDLWLGDYKSKGFHWDVIQLNHGLHDLKQSFDEKSKSYGPHQVALEEYKKNLYTILTNLEKTGAKLIWCSTTPVPNDSHGQFGRRKDEDKVFNEAALSVVEKFSNIHINDLNQTVRTSKVFDSWREGNNVHFYNEEQTALGNAVAEAVLKRLAD